MKVRLQESNVIDSIALSLWNIFRGQNSSLSSEDRFNFINSDTVSRNREDPMSTAPSWVSSLLKICI